MDAKSIIVPVLMAVSSLPLFVVGGLVAKGRLDLINGLDADRIADRAALAGRLSRYLLAMAVVLLASGGAMFWAGTDERRMLWIVLATVVLVNALAIALVFAVARAKRAYRPGPRRA